MNVRKHNRRPPRRPDKVAASAIGPWLHPCEGDYNCRYLGTEYSRQGRIRKTEGPN